ncbi:MAG: hypothetical protein WAV07_03550 [Candidatus Contendobacter sp.]
MSLHFLSYAEAFAALQSRYPDLTEAELRMWVNGKRSLVALTDHPGKTRSSRLRHPPFRFHWSGSGDQSINALLDCWFPSKQIVRFVPSRRYLTYGQLVERWRSRTLEDIHAFITEQVEAFRNKSGFGFFDFGAFDPLGRLDLPMKDYVFALDQVEEMERRWFIEPAPRPQSQLRPFQAEDVRYFSRRLRWSEQIAGYLVQGCVRVDATGHYCYDDFPVVWTWPTFENGAVQPPEADYVDVFSSLAFPIEPLVFVEFCERRNIPLPSELIIKVKEIAGVVALSKLAIAVPTVACPTPPDPAIPPRTKGTLYELIAALFLSGYGHVPDLEILQRDIKDIKEFDPDFLRDTLKKVSEKCSKLQ